MTKFSKFIIIFIVSIALIYMYSFNSYRIRKFDDFLTYDECDYIIEKANKKEFQNSKVTSMKDGIKVDVPSPSRTSTNLFLHTENDELLKRIDRQVEEICGKPIENYEALQVVKYTGGQFYNEHFDATHHDKRGGLRFCTVLIYLNDDFEEGTTYFPLLKEHCVPKKGSAVLFYDVCMWPFNDCIHPMSKHAGIPPKNGTKYICNKWVRCKKYI